MKSKIAAIIVFVALASALFTACGRIDFTYRQNYDGTYTQTISVILDTDGVISAGFSPDEAFKALENGFSKNGYEVSVKDFSLTAVKNFETVRDLHADAFGNGIIVDDNGVSYDENAFFLKQTVTGEIIVSDEFIGKNRTWLVSVLCEGGLALEDAKKAADAITGADTSYSFITPYRSTKTNADSVTKDKNGFYRHTWNFDGENSRAVIEVSQIKGAAWYGVAIVVAAGVVLIVASVRIATERGKRGRKEKDK